MVNILVLDTRFEVHEAVNSYYNGKSIKHAYNHAQATAIYQSHRSFSAILIGKRFPHKVNGSPDLVDAIKKCDPGTKLITIPQQLTKESLVKLLQ